MRFQMQYFCQLNKYTKAHKLCAVCHKGTAAVFPKEQKTMCSLRKGQRCKKEVRTAQLHMRNWVFKPYK